MGLVKRKSPHTLRGDTVDDSRNVCNRNRDKCNYPNNEGLMLLRLYQRNRCHNRQEREMRWR